MSEETKKTVEETPAEEPNTAPQAEPAAAPEETAAAPETDESEKTDGKKKEGFVKKKARELEAVKAKLDAAEKNANQAKDCLLYTSPELLSGVPARGLPGPDHCGHRGAERGGCRNA